VIAVDILRTPVSGRPLNRDLKEIVDRFGIHRILPQPKALP
jgi:hypothetical protein